MRIQKSFQDEKAKLYLVATPIGNLQEMTPRAIEILKEVDLILAEDTRTSGVLLKHFGIKTPLSSYHLHNENQRIDFVLEKLNEGKNIALISDAGYPLISDPGQKLVQKVAQEDFAIIPVSGSSAFLNALVASGLVSQPFTFMGFLEKKEGPLKSQLQSVASLEHTLIFYLSVHQVEKTIDRLVEILGNRKVSLAREITKLHEEFIRTDLETLKKASLTLKGEFVLVIEGKKKEESSLEDLILEVDELVMDGLKASRAIAQVAKAHKFSKNDLYQAYLKAKE